MHLRIDQVRCVFCGTSSLDIYQADVECKECGHSFPSYQGVKFIGSYNTEDTLGLLEITSKIRMGNNPDADRKNVEDSEQKLHEKFQEVYVGKVISNSESKGHAVGSVKMAQASRLIEWSAFELLSEGIDFEGKLCLDMGAGLGSDSVRLINRGAKVVCMDYNPVSIVRGAQIVPEAQWLGGNSDCLPFVSDTFDCTVANAALHHMHDRHASVQEMCRVTKPGGYVFIVSDPFMKSVESKADHELAELKVFDRHPMVLNGINEGIIPFNDYIEPIERLAPSTKMLTMRIHGNNKTYTEVPSYWTLDQAKKELSGRSGNISSLISVAPNHLEAPKKSEEEISTSLLFESIGDPRKSMDFLAPHVDVKYFDNFPFQQSSKFLLMNGWHFEQDLDSDWRTGYNRTRLFLTRSYLSKMDKILVRANKLNTVEDLRVYLYLNARLVDRFSIAAGSSHTVPIDSLVDSLADRNVLEFGIADANENKGAIWSPYSVEKRFDVAIV